MNFFFFNFDFLIFMGLIDWLRLPEAKDVDLDAPSTTVQHARIIRQKPFLRRLYVDFYTQIRNGLPADLSGKKVLELGSGGGFMKEIIPGIITSDVIELPDVDMHFSALDMPFESGSLDAIVMMDVLHHIPDVRQFFREASRTLKPGGKIVMVEPANTMWGRFIYRNFHHEPFIPSAKWELDSTGPMSSANGAIPWIVFRRDRREFEKEFPGFTINRFRAHTPFRYLLSGGVSMHQLVPSFSYPLISLQEWLLTPFHPLIGMFYYIEVVKK